jgi:hypothetical protein
MVENLINLIVFCRQMFRYMHCHWRSNNQEKEGCDPMKRFIHASFLCLARTRVLNVICRGLFNLQWFEVRGDFLFFFYFGRIVDHHCLNFIFIISNKKQFYILYLVSNITHTVLKYLVRTNHPQPNQTITSHLQWLNMKKTMTYDIGNPGTGFFQSCIVLRFVASDYPFGIFKLFLT